MACLVDSVLTIGKKRRKQMTSASVLDRIAQTGRRYFDSAREAYVEKLETSDFTASQKATLIRYAGIKPADSNGDKKTETEVTEDDGQLDVLKAKKMLRWLAEGVGRGLELNGGGTETPKDVQALHQLLLTHMGDIYIDSSLDWAVDMATSQESVTKAEPDLSYLPSLRTSIQILHLLQTSVNTMLLPLALSNVTIRRDVEKTTTATLSRLESKVSIILHKTLMPASPGQQDCLQIRKRQTSNRKKRTLTRPLELCKHPPVSPSTTSYPK